MGLPPPLLAPRPAKPVIIMPTPNTRSLLGIAASRRERDEEEEEERGEGEEGEEKSFLVKLLTALCISARETTFLGRIRAAARSPGTTSKRKSRVLSLRPKTLNGLKACGIKRRWRKVRKFEDRGERKMDGYNSRKGLLLLARCDLGRWDYVYNVRDFTLNRLGWCFIVRLIVILLVKKFVDIEKCKEV